MLVIDHALSDTGWPVVFTRKIDLINNDGSVNTLVYKNAPNGKRPFLTGNFSYNQEYGDLRLWLPCGCRLDPSSDPLFHISEAARINLDECEIYDLCPWHFLKRFLFISFMYMAPLSVLFELSRTILGG